LFTFSAEGVSTEAFVVGSGVTVTAKTRVLMLSFERLLMLNIGLLSNHPERRRQIEARGASPLMRERRSNALMMHQIWPQLQEERQHGA
jgi:hypothetical protein